MSGVRNESAAAAQAQEEAGRSMARPVAAPVAGGEKINSPMPGTILDVRVSAGQSVKKGQVLCILEAMKMENEIISPRDGAVAQVVANKGASVNAGDPLMVLQ